MNRAFIVGFLVVIVSTFQISSGAPLGDTLTDLMSDSKLQSSVMNVLDDLKKVNSQEIAALLKKALSLVGNEGAKPAPVAVPAARMTLTDAASVNTVSLDQDATIDGKSSVGARMTNGASLSVNEGAAVTANKDATLARMTLTNDASVSNAAGQDATADVSGWAAPVARMTGGSSASLSTDNDASVNAATGTKDATLARMTLTDDASVSSVANQDATVDASGWAAPVARMTGGMSATLTAENGASANAVTGTQDATLARMTLTNGASVMSANNGDAAIDAEVNLTMQ